MQVVVGLELIKKLRLFLPITITRHLACSVHFSEVAAFEAAVVTIAADEACTTFDS